MVGLRASSPPNLNCEYRGWGTCTKLWHHFYFEIRNWCGWGHEPHFLLRSTTWKSTSTSGAFVVVFSAPSVPLVFLFSNPQRRWVLFPYYSLGWMDGAFFFSSINLASPLSLSGAAVGFGVCCWDRVKLCLHPTDASSELSTWQQHVGKWVRGHFKHFSFYFDYMLFLIFL